MHGLTTDNVRPTLLKNRLETVQYRWTGPAWCWNNDDDDDDVTEDEPATVRWTRELTHLRLTDCVCVSVCQFVSVWVLHVCWLSATLAAS